MKKLLLVVDFQNDFVNGSLGFDSAAQLDQRIAGKIYNARTSGWDIAFTFDTHGENYLNTQEGTMLPVAHCIYKSKGWELYGNVGKLISEKDKRFEKSGFGSAKLLAYLQEHEYERIEIVGLVTNICVIANAVLAKTALPEAEIIVDSSCVDSYDKGLHEKALDVMEGLQIKITGR